VSAAGPVGPRIVAFVPDLMDRSRLQAAAEALGVKAQLALVSSVGDLEALGQGGSVELILADLSRPGVLEALASLPSKRTVGFASHVDRGTLDAARAAGCSTVLARSAFFSRLGPLLQEIL
jgi:hypothetical protein